MIERKIKSVKQLKKTIDLLRSKGRRIVFTNGCFDILHYGHARYLEQAKEKGDVLVVAVNSDSSLKMLKGDKRPLVKEKERIRLVAALESVDYVTVFGQSTPIKVITALRPDVLVKGGDWAGGKIVGKEFVESYHGRVMTIPYVKGISTSNLIKKIAEKFRR